MALASSSCESGELRGRAELFLRFHPLEFLVDSFAEGLPFSLLHRFRLRDPYSITYSTENGQGRKALKIKLRRVKMAHHCLFPKV